MSTVPIEVNGKLSALQTISAATPHLGNPYFSNPTYLNFEPRVGFALDPFQNGKLSVRAGFGLYDVLPLLYEFEISESFNVQFRFEAFNIFNHSNFGIPNNNNQQLFDGTGHFTGAAGVLSFPTATTSRQLQFALKVTWCCRGHCR